MLALPPEWEIAPAPFTTGDLTQLESNESNTWITYRYIAPKVTANSAASSVSQIGENSAADPTSPLQFIIIARTPEVQEETDENVSEQTQNPSTINRPVTFFFIFCDEVLSEKVSENEQLKNFSPFVQRLVNQIRTKAARHSLDYIGIDLVLGYQVSEMREWMVDKIFKVFEEFSILSTEAIKYFRSLCPHKNVSAEEEKNILLIKHALEFFAEQSSVPAFKDEVYKTAIEIARRIHTAEIQENAQKKKRYFDGSDVALELGKAFEDNFDLSPLYAHEIFSLLTNASPLFGEAQRHLFYPAIGLSESAGSETEKRVWREKAIYSYFKGMSLTKYYVLLELLANHAGYEGVNNPFVNEQDPTLSHPLSVLVLKPMLILANEIYKGNKSLQLNMCSIDSASPSMGSSLIDTKAQCEGDVIKEAAANFNALCNKPSVRGILDFQTMQSDFSKKDYGAVVALVEKMYKNDRKENQEKLRIINNGIGHDGPINFYFNSVDDFSFRIGEILMGISPVNACRAFELITMDSFNYIWAQEYLYTLTLQLSRRAIAEEDRRVWREKALAAILTCCFLSQKPFFLEKDALSLFVELVELHAGYDPKSSRRLFSDLPTFSITTLLDFNFDHFAKMIITLSNALYNINKPREPKQAEISSSELVVSTTASVSAGMQKQPLSSQEQLGNDKTFPEERFKLMFEKIQDSFAKQHREESLAHASVVHSNGEQKPPAIVRQYDAVAAENADPKVVVVNSKPHNCCKIRVGALDFGLF